MNVILRQGTKWRSLIIFVSCLAAKDVLAVMCLESSALLNRLDNSLHLLSTCSDRAYIDNREVERALSTIQSTAQLVSGDLHDDMAERILQNGATSVTDHIYHLISQVCILLLCAFTLI